MKTAIYTRISEDDAEGDERGKGVARQEKDARAEIERRDWELVDVYADNDVSATRSKVRPQYQRLIRDIRAGLIQAVIVWDIDRLTRTPREIEDFIELADSSGLTLINLTGAGDVGTDDGRMMLRIKGALARREVEQMRKRLKRKFEENADDGKPHGRAPYGMQRVQERDSRGKLVNFWDVPDPKTAPIVRELAIRALKNDSLRSIAADLTKRGIPGPNAPTWNSTVIRQVLLRPSYAGIRMHRGKPVGHLQGEQTDRLFDLETHERLVALLTDPSRKQNHRGREPLYLLSGIAKCGRCGGSMRSAIGRMTTTAKGTKRQPPSYVCSVCFKVRRQRERVDELVEATAIQQLHDSRIIDGLSSKGDAQAARESRKMIEEIDAKLALATDQYADDEITPEQFRRLTARLRDRRGVAVSRLRAAAPNERLAEFTQGAPQATWEAASMLARREVVDTLFTVTIYPQGSGKRFDENSISVVPRQLDEGRP